MLLGHLKEQFEDATIKRLIGKYLKNIIISHEINFTKSLNY